MSNHIKIILGLLIFILMFFLFNKIEFEQLNPAGNKYFQSSVFSVTLIISIFWSKFRNRLLYISFFLLFLMLGTYLMQKIALSSALASLGIGIMLIVTLSYIPQIVKQGYVEKL